MLNVKSRAVIHFRICVRPPEQAHPHIRHQAMNPSSQSGFPDKDPEKSAAARLDEFNHSLLEAIKEASPDGILVVNELFEVVSFNQRFLTIWNIDPGEIEVQETNGGIVADQRLLDIALTRIKDPDAFLRQVQLLYQNPHQRDRSVIELIDGRTLERHSTGLHADTGRYLGRVWFFRDITVHKEDQAMLQYLAWHDPLTGVMNRGYFFERADQELQRSRDKDRPLAFVVLDMDHFKAINDQFGHHAGDVTLETVCQCWMRVLRPTDLIGRIGGEEFALVLSDSDAEVALSIAERLRQTVEEQPIAVDDRKIPCTVSCGVTMAIAADSDTETAMRRADKALYRAKQLGRNRVEFAC